MKNKIKMKRDNVVKTRNVHVSSTSVYMGQPFLSYNSRFMCIFCFFLLAEAGSHFLFV